MVLEIKGKYSSAKVMIDDIEESTYSQIQGILNCKRFEDSEIVIMPDCHAGKGSVVGFTMKMKDRICPNLIGVDIGCGMVSCNIGKELPSTLDKIDKVIREKVPTGFKKHKKVKKVNVIEQYKDFDFDKYDIRLSEVCNRIEVKQYEVKCQIGSLGGGNHFIELGIDDNKDYWITIHSGSRNFGSKVANYWQSQAIKDEEIEYEIERQNIINSVDKTLLNDRLREMVRIEKDLSHLSPENSKEYLRDMEIAQKFASVNRYKMLDLILKGFELKPIEVIESIHNYINFNDGIVRKGAISSYSDEKMIIPFNMRDGLLICRGKDNRDWNYSAPHGAGRVLSRSKAKEVVDLEEFRDSMNGVYQVSLLNGGGLSLVDESPVVYKDFRVIENAIVDSVDILLRVKPILNIKG